MFDMDEVYIDKREVEYVLGEVNTLDDLERFVDAVTEKGMISGIEELEDEAELLF